MIGAPEFLPTTLPPPAEPPCCIGTQRKAYQWTATATDGSHSAPRLMPGSSTRLGGAQPPTPPLPALRWIHDDRCLSFATGALLSFLVCCGVELSGGNEKSPIMFVFVGLFIITVLAHDHVIRKFRPEFQARGGWCWFGVAIGMIVFMPLIITTPCGWQHWDCKPVHPVHHAHK